MFSTTVGRVAWDMAADVARHGAGIGVITAARRKADDKANLLAAVELAAQRRSSAGKLSMSGRHDDSRLLSKYGFFMTPPLALEARGSRIYVSYVFVSSSAFARETAVLLSPSARCSGFP